MNRRESYRYIDYIPKYRRCEEKMLHIDISEAKKVVKQHHRRLAVCEGISVYWCWRHKGWHVGHRYKYRPSNQQFLDDVEWFIRYESGELRN